MKNKKIYLVTSGEYSDYSVDGVFTTCEKAQDFIDSIAVTDDHRIEVHDLNPLTIFQREGVNWYRVSFNVMTGFIYDTNVHSEWEYTWRDDRNKPYRETWRGEFIYGVMVKAKDKDHAIKIVGDIRRELKLKLRYEK